MAIIQTTNLQQQFGERIIFDGVNLALQAGRSYALVGRSGSGKTTLLNTLSGLAEPTQGAVTIAGEKLTASNIRRLRRDTFGYIFQNFGLVDDGTVEQNLQIGWAAKRTGKRERQTQFRVVLDQVGLPDLALDQRIYTLSGGEQQRVALARLLLKAPKIVFADEPTGSVDADNAEQIVTHLLTDFGPDATIIIATHAPAVMARCDEILEITDRRVVNRTMEA